MISCVLRRARKKLSVDRRRGDGGFTLIELLVVLVILPLIIGAVAEAIIVSFQNQPSTSNRLADTTNAQLTTQYFVRDVQGASEVTTDQQLFQAGSYSQYSPQLCGTSSSESLLVALYRPGINGAAPLDVAYWQRTDGNGLVEVVRYSCSLQANYTSTSAVAEVLDSPPPGTLTGNAALSKPITATASITPNQFAQSASNGWASTEAQTVVSSSVSSLSSASTIDVASIAGFAAPGTLTISTSLGAGTVTCAGKTSLPPSFTGCSNAAPASVANGAVPIGALVTQSNLSAVQLTVQEPTSSYEFNVVGTPRGGSVSSSTVGSGGPTLLALGSNGITLTGNGSYNCTLGGNNAKICVNGDVVIDGGLNCQSGSIFASGTIASATGPTTCNGSTITYTPAVSDPIAPTLPSCFATSAELATNPPTHNGDEVPGIYTNTPVGGTLEPGVYVAEDGVSGSITTANPTPSDPYFKENPSGSYDANSGLLIYLPGVGPYPPGCITVSQAAVSSASLNFPNNASVNVVPLDSGQSAYYFYGNTGVADMWAWQDKTNTNDLLSSKGNSSFCSGNIHSGSFAGECAQQQVATKSVLFGLLYAPSGVVTLGGNSSVGSGRMTVGGVSPQNGTPGVTLTGG
jgi:prepilin-type N-terminal cleavage/methylation domain-containing protein